MIRQITCQNEWLLSIVLEDDSICTTYYRIHIRWEFGSVLRYWQLIWTLQTVSCHRCAARPAPVQDPEGCTLSENLNMTVFPAAVKTYLEHTWTFSPLALFSFYARQMNEILLPCARARGQIFHISSRVPCCFHVVHHHRKGIRSSSFSSRKCQESIFVAKIAMRIAVLILFSYRVLPGHDTVDFVVCFHSVISKCGTFLQENAINHRKKNSHRHCVSLGPSVVWYGRNA